MAAKNPCKDMAETNNKLTTTAKENYSKINNNNSSPCNNMHIDNNAINKNTTTKSESSTCCNPTSLKVRNKKTNSGIKSFDEPVIIIDEDITNNNEGTVSEHKTMETNEHESSLHQTNQFLDKPSVCISQSVAIDKNINNQSKRKVKLDDNESPIVIEDNEKDNDCTIVEIDKIISKNHSTRKTQSSLVKHYKKIYKENRLFTDIIDRCLDMENTDGMLRIINRTLVPLYMDVDETRKTKSGFQKALFKAFRNLDNEPEKKFSHVKNLTIFLKTQKRAKKVDIVPLKNCLNGLSTKKKTSNLINEILPKRKKHDIIDLDDDNSDTDVQIKIIDVKGHVPEKNLLLVTSDNSNDRNEEQIVIDETETESNQNYEVFNNTDQDDDVILVDAGNNNKENEDNMVKNNNKLITQTQVRSDTSIANKAGNNINNDELLQIDLSDEPDQTFVTTYLCGMKDYMAQDMILPDGSIENKIQFLEEKLAVYHNKIKVLEETEVVEGFSSPYVECDMLKSHIVRLYKELCNLTGSVPVKRHKVRLKAVEGRHEGPVRCLEQFINDNIGEDGNPPFPDMHDVTDCVYKADSIYNMGWDKKKIEEEARALFIHYGRTVQKRRMKREWRYLMSYMKDDLPDPADEDAELQARLQRNKLIAMKNEEELLDRFVEEEHSSTLRLSVDPNKNKQRHQRISTNNTKHTLITTNINTQNKDTLNTTTASSLNINSYEKGSTGNITNNIIIYPLPAPVQYAIAPCVIGYNVVPNMVSKLPTSSSEVLLGNPDTSKNCPMHQNLGVNSNSGVINCAAVNGVISNLAGIPDTSKNGPIQQNLGVTSNGVIGCSCSIMNRRISNLAGDSDASKNGHIQQNLEVNSNNRVMNCLVYKKNTSNLAGYPGTSNNSITQQNVEVNISGAGSVIDQMSSNVASYAKVDIEVEDSDIPSTSKADESIVNNTDGVSFLNNSDMSKPCVIENTEAGTSEVDFKNLPVKREPLDIPKMLYQLGSDYTATIIDIEDPFLVIEISDSSDSEDEPDDIKL